MINKFSNYIKSSISELKKVAWPSRKETTNHTILVIGISLGLAAFLGLIDFFLTKLLQVIL
ncbi:MAG: preprotein translocase subunit SecE [Patescibacteria group bacterium]|nr:preprotein translocase subunit SecE [Patescibacteria group bacterium]MDD5164047.1 preprotein translocase subunit SecE [Patescibacteria group bacterium]MDD5534869.1 preprotein translocase subunit SecE [Patescibacteria group bacterium]